MLTVRYVDDENKLSSLFEKLQLKSADFSGIIAVLYENEEAKGFCRMHLGQSCVDITDFKLTDEAMGEHGVADFFFRTILFKLSKTSMLVRVGTVDNRLKPFGFVADDQGMSVIADNIEFPSECGCHDKKKN